MTKTKTKRKTATVNTYGGYTVHIGKGLKEKPMDRLETERCYDEWPSRQVAPVIHVVVKEQLDTGEGETPRVFKDPADALEYARALSNGNVDHRVLTVTDQIIVRGNDQ